VFHCFACGAGGNVLDFVAGMEGCSVRVAALRLQGSYGPGNGSVGGPASEAGQVNPPLGFTLNVDITHPPCVRRDPSLRLQPMQSWIERPGFHLQQFLRRLLDIPGDCVPMRRAAEQGP